MLWPTPTACWLEFTVERGRRHVETIVPAISFVCRSAGVALRDLEAVAVDIGPGLFTGLRVGISTAKAMGLALDVPLCGATSLEVAGPGRGPKRRTRRHDGGGGRRRAPR